MKMFNHLVRPRLCVQAWKKIEETKKKAVDIMQVRQRNAEKNEEKNMIAHQRAEEDFERQ